MSDIRPVLLRLNQNLNLLLERQARYGDNPPLELLNQIEDHREAIRLTEQAVAGEIGEADWRQALEPLLVAIHHRSGEAAVHLTININQAPEPSPGPSNTPTWRRLVSAGIVVTLLAGIAGFFNDSLGIIYGPLFPTPTPTVTPTSTVTPTATPTPLPTATPLAVPTASEDETLILIASFYEPSPIRADPHVKIQRAIKEVAGEMGLNTLRVELEPTILKADQREEAEILGRLYNASIIIWGEDTGVQMIVNFLNLKQPDFEAAEVRIEEKERVQITNPDAYAEFVLEDLPAQFTFLSLFAVGQSYYVTKQYEQARDTIQRGIDSLSEKVQPPGLARAYFRLGWLRRELKEPLQSAIEDYNRAIELDPAYVNAYNGRGAAYGDLGDYQAAFADYNKAIELDPNFALAYYNRGYDNQQ